jgi:hypothetical protein
LIQKSRANQLFLFFTLLISILGGYLIFQATSWGPWAFSDSAAYISAARNIQVGKGAVMINSNGSATPVSEFPPLFPFILSLLTPFKGNFVLTDKIFDITLFSVSILILGLISFITFENLLLSLISSIIFAISPLMVDTYSGFMSEPLFITLLLLLVLFFILLLKSQKKIFIFPVILISMLLPLVRYAGILFMLCFGLFFLLFRKKLHLINILVIPAYIVVSLTPIGLWFLNQYENLDKVGGKRFAFNHNFINTFFKSISQEFLLIGT